MAKRINIYFYCFFLLANGSILFAQNEKCGTFRQVERNWKNKLSKIGRVLITRPLLDTNILTSNKKIRIHFDTSGTNQPAMVDLAGNRIPNSYQEFIDTLSSILDSVWKAEIEAFNFNVPPGDNGRGGGDEYDFYITHFYDGTFGVTNIEDDLPIGPTKTNQQYASFIQIDNDFGIGYRTKGVQALMATTAHEFHHAIQVGGSGVWEEKQFYFYELCAEAMENTVFNDAKDYIHDVKTYFANISSTPLFQQSQGLSTAGYERALWGMFLMKKYGTGIMKEIWDEMKTNRPIPALKNTLSLHLSTTEKEFSNFSLWNFYTNYRADSTKYFIDAKLFPSVNFSERVSLTNTEEVIQKISRSFVTNFIRVDHELDTAFFIIANTNLADAESNIGQSFPFQLQASPFPNADYLKINNSIYAKFTVNDLQNWNYALSTDTTDVHKPLNFDFVSAFPNPFKPNGSNIFFILMDENSTKQNKTELHIFSPTSDLVFSGESQFANIFGKKFAVWNGKDNNGNIIPSGIYLYFLYGESKVIKGKFAVIR
ncbi:MAG: hypothetical protein Q8L88_00740 [Bacteroidota bacterium]|nr:hypothetical protein [Bacteroidota bacterium]